MTVCGYRSRFLRYHGLHVLFFSFFFFNDTATTEIYTLSLHDALPILLQNPLVVEAQQPVRGRGHEVRLGHLETRSEEHTSELQSRLHLVCRLLLEKKKTPRPTEGRAASVASYVLTILRCPRPRQ